MEINKEKLKPILKYLFRVCIFLLLSRKYMFNLTFPIGEYILKLFINPENIDLFAFGGGIALITIFVQSYILAKVCGLFKSINSLKFYNALTIILVIDVLYSFSLSTVVQMPCFKVVFDYKNFVILFVLTISFIIFKLLNMLSTKYPLPFKYIGDIFSFDFYKGLYKKYADKV